jgi:16S rRNA processing protein RimM
VAGRVGRPHGLDGSFHVIRPRADLLAEGAVLEIAGASREVVRRAGTDQRPILRLEGCEDRDAAEALRGEDLRVRRADAPAREPGEYWAEELEGCRVQDGEVVVGVVRRLVALPSCEALEVARADDTDLLVPLVRDAVRRVDPAARRIDVDLRFLGAT